jgi:hypothetical protein
VTRRGAATRGQAAAWAAALLLTAAAGPAAASGTRWLVVGASDPVPAGIAQRARALSAVETRAGGSAGIVLSTADCGERKAAFAWAAEVATTREAAQAALDRLIARIPDAYVKRCVVRPGSLLALGLPAIDPSIADVAADAVNWTDADRVSTVRALGGGASLLLLRYRAAVAEDPLEGRRTRVQLALPGTAPVPLIDDCAGLAGAVFAHGWVALACDSEQAADHVLHTVQAFSAAGERVVELTRCRQPSIPAADTLQCQQESVDAEGRLKLAPRRVRLAR